MTIKKRGLGRGLDALLGDVPVTEEKHRLETLPIEMLQRGKYQPRKDIDPEKLQELADSIKAQGIVQPIVVRRLEDEKYEIVAGERRWRAGQLAGLHDVPVVIKDVDDRTAMAVALIENIQREDLNPLEEAEALRRLLDEFTMTHQQIADAVGKAQAEFGVLAQCRVRFGGAVVHAGAVRRQGRPDANRALRIPVEELVPRRVGRTAAT